MTRMTCLTGDDRPMHQRGFCATCWETMGGTWRRRVLTGRREWKQRAVQMLLRKRRSIKEIRDAR